MTKEDFMDEKNVEFVRKELIKELRKENEELRYQNQRLLLIIATMLSGGFSRHWPITS